MARCACMRCIPGAPGSARTRPCAAEARGARPGSRSGQLRAGHHQVHRAHHQLAGPVRIGCARRNLERRSVRGCGWPPGQPGHSIRPGGHTALGNCAPGGARAPPGGLGRGIRCRACTGRHTRAVGPWPRAARACMCVAGGGARRSAAGGARRSRRRAQLCVCTRTPAVRLHRPAAAARPGAPARAPCRRAPRQALRLGRPPRRALRVGSAAGAGQRAGRAGRQPSFAPASPGAPPPRAGTWADQRQYRPWARCLHATGAGATRGVQAPRRGTCAALDLRRRPVACLEATT